MISYNSQWPISGALLQLMPEIQQKLLFIVITRVPSTKYNMNYLRNSLNYLRNSNYLNKKKKNYAWCHWLIENLKLVLMKLLASEVAPKMQVSCSVGNIDSFTNFSTSWHTSSGKFADLMELLLYTNPSYCNRLVNNRSALRLKAHCFLQGFYILQHRMLILCIS